MDTETRKYCNPSINKSFYTSDGEVIKSSEKLREILFSSVERHLISDVPVGSCLSGGVDSSSIVCIINSILQRREIPQIGDMQKTFTFSSIDRRIDESNFAREVVKKCKTHAFFIEPGPNDFIKDIENVVYYQDEPFVSTSIYAQFKVMEKAHFEGVKVLLDGQGADELFAGYGKMYFPSFLTHALYSKNITQFLSETAKRYTLNKNEFVESLIYLPSFIFMSFEKKLWGKIIVLPHFIPKEKRFPIIKAFKKDFLYEFRERFSEFISRFFENAGNLNSFLLDSVFKFSLPGLLRYEDRNSMAFSIEARPVFADDVEIIDFALSLPTSAKIRDGWTKYVLRLSMKEIVPKKVIWRRDKFAFFSPESIWIKENKNFFLPYISDIRDDFIDSDFVIKNFDELLKHGSAMWRIINLRMWQEKFFGHS